MPIRRRSAVAFPTTTTTTCTTTLARRDIIILYARDNDDCSVVKRLIISNRVALPRRPHTRHHRRRLQTGCLILTNRSAFTASEIDMSANNQLQHIRTTPLRLTTATHQTDPCTIFRLGCHAKVQLMIMLTDFPVFRFFSSLRCTWNTVLHSSRIPRK